MCGSRRWERNVGEVWGREGGGKDILIFRSTSQKTLLGVKHDLKISLFFFFFPVFCVMYDSVRLEAPKQLAARQRSPEANQLVDFKVRVKFFFFFFRLFRLS